MKKNKLAVAFFVCATAIVLPTTAHSEDRKFPPVAEEQSTRENQNELTREIREALVNDESLSIPGKNVTVITTPDGVVTLRGAVDNAAEREKIGSVAKRFAGSQTIRNEILVKDGQARARMAQ